MKLTILILALFVSSNLLYSQGSGTYSDPIAPVGNIQLTVPSSVRPLFDYWMRDVYVLMGPDSLYYMISTTANPNRIFAVNVHCWDYNNGLYMWKSPDLKNWESMGLIWSYDKDATWQKTKTKAVASGAKSVNGDPLDSMYRAVWAPKIH